MDKTFRLFVNQKVPDMGVVGGKIPGLFPWKLGNLTLTAYNGELADKDFYHKKEELHKSHLEINNKEDIENKNDGKDM